MATEPSENDLRLLNALLDGELEPDEHARAAARLATDRDFARAHASLARLKAAVAAGVDDEAPVPLPAPRKRIQTRLAVAAVAVLVLVSGLAVLLLGRPVATPPASPLPVTLAGLPGDPLVPSLDGAGLTLSGVATHDEGPALVASYRGPHGCRLDLRVSRRGAALAPLDGSSRRAWNVGDIGYELVAHGMPAERFAAIAEAAEQQTRRADPGSVERRLREARLPGATCAG